MGFSRTKFSDSRKLYTTDAHEKHFNFYNLPPIFVILVLLPTTLCQHLLTIYHSNLTGATIKTFRFWEAFLTLTQNHNSVYLTWFVNSILCKNFFLYYGKSSILWNIFLIFVTEHYINISLVLNLLFNSSMCCQLLVLFLSPQHHLAIDSLLVFLFWLHQYHASKKIVLFLSFHLLANINSTIL